MDLIWAGIVKAFELLFTGNREVWGITLLTLKVSGTATLFSLLLGVPMGMALGLASFPGRRFLVSVVNTGMGLPPVVAGLVITVFLWRSGPLGQLRLLYTPAAMVLAQALIATPIVTGLTIAAVQQISRGLRLQLLALGASRLQLFWALVREARLPLLAAVIAGFGGVISEVGASMMVGGNIRGQTQVLTTATVLEVSRGNFDVAFALGTILLALTYTITLALTTIQQRRRAG